MLSDLVQLCGYLSGGVWRCSWNLSDRVRVSPRDFINLYFDLALLSTFAAFPWWRTLDRSQIPRTDLERGTFHPTHGRTANTFLAKPLSTRCMPDFLKHNAILYCLISPFSLSSRSFSHDAFAVR